MLTTGMDGYLTLPIRHDWFLPPSKIWLLPDYRCIIGTDTFQFLMKHFNSEQNLCC